VAIFNYHWVPAPIGAYLGEGRRWELIRGTLRVGRVVQLLEGGMWEAYGKDDNYLTSGHDSIGKAALALLRHLEQQRKPGQPLTARLGDFLQLKSGK
jgi:hypothetical protein